MCGVAGKGTVCVGSASAKLSRTKKRWYPFATESRRSMVLGANRGCSYRQRMPPHLYAAPKRLRAHRAPIEKKAVTFQVTAISAHRCRRSTTLGNQIAYVILKVKHPTPPQKSPSTSHHYPTGKKIEGLFNESARSGQLADNRCAANNAGLTKGHPRVRRPGKRRGETLTCLPLYGVQEPAPVPCASTR